MALRAFYQALIQAQVGQYSDSGPQDHVMTATTYG